MLGIMPRLVVMKMTNSKEELCWYKVVFKQLTPIHIGQKNYGVLSETRLFIPQWTMWGALVNAYGKIQGGKDDDFKEGKELFKSTTCFFPILNKEGYHIMFPNFKNGKLYIGDMKEEEFRLKFTDTYVSTSISPEYIAAKDGSLHETEIILPKSKKDGSQIYWVGLVGIEESKKEKFVSFIKQCEDVFIGGDIGYGLGRLRVLQNGINDADEECLKNWNLKLDGEVICNGEPIRKYLRFNQDYTLQKGKLEFVVQYDFSGRSPSIVKKGCFFVPGSEVKKI